MAPLRLLARAVIALVGTPAMPGVFYRGLRLMGLDSFVVDVPDSAANDRVFGRPGRGQKRGAFPQARVLSLCELGTHVLWRSSIKPRHEPVTICRRCCATSRRVMLLWDRGFLSYERVRQVCQQAAHLLARIKKNLIFQPIRRLPDGSYVAKLYRSPQHRKHDRDGIMVRIIEYTLNDPGRSERSASPGLTTLLDAGRHPAKRLIMLYHERWEHEIAIDELKTHECERPVLRHAGRRDSGDRGFALGALRRAGADV